MAKDSTTPAEEPDHVAAAVADPGSLRNRVGRSRFRSEVRDGLDTELKARAKRKDAGFKPSEVPHILDHVTDADIDDAAEHVRRQTAGAEAAGGQAAGPLIDWFQAHPELVNAVIAALLKRLLG